MRLVECLQLLMESMTFTGGHGLDSSHGVLLGGRCDLRVKYLPSLANTVLLIFK